MKVNEVTLVCAVCEGRSFFAMPDGADSYLLECTTCGKRSEISAGRGMTLTLVEVEDERPMSGRITAWDLGKRFAHVDADHLAPPPSVIDDEQDDDELTDNAATDAITEAITGDAPDGDEGEDTEQPEADDVDGL